MIDTLYTFFYNNYSWIVLLALLPALNSLRRYITLKFGSFAIMRMPKGISLIRGKLRDPKVQNIYLQDAYFSAAASILILLASILVPRYQSTSAVVISSVCLLAGVILYLFSLIRAEYTHRQMMKKIREITIARMRELIQKKKDEMHQ